MARTKEKMSLPRKIVLIISIIVFCVAAGMLIQYYVKGLMVQNEFRKLQVNGDHDLVALHKQNPDVVGWIKVEDTRIDYPVMQTPEDPEFYLRRNFQKEYSIAGTPFMDASSVIGTSRNYLIYGHNMKNGSMFHQLLKYEDEDFYKEHKTFTYDEYLDGVQVNGTYEVVAAFRTQIYNSSSDYFKYHYYAMIEDEETFTEYVDGIKELSAYDTGVTPEWGDRLVTLSTCAYHVQDVGRYVVVGRKID